VADSHVLVEGVLVVIAIGEGNDDEGRTEDLDEAIGRGRYRPSCRCERERRAGWSAAGRRRPTCRWVSRWGFERRGYSRRHSGGRTTCGSLTAAWKILFVQAVPGLAARAVTILIR
jgi:hypothetical protein